MADRIYDDSTCLYSHETTTGEWLETDGRGGYASSTVMHCHTRRYHGLMVANLAKPAGRHVLLSKFEDSFLSGEEGYFFSCHQYPGVSFLPERPCLTDFTNNLAPRFHYQIGLLSLSKTLMLQAGCNTLLIRYDMEDAPSPGFLCLKPFLAFRGFHALRKRDDLFNTSVLAIKNGFAIQPYTDMPRLSIWADVQTEFRSSPDWYFNFEYPVERERGYDFQEDLFCPGVLKIPMKKGQSVIVSVASEVSTIPLKRKWRDEERRRGATQKGDEVFAAAFPEADQDNIRQLLKAGRQFLIRSHDDRPTIIAGYHWFNDWGRDTLISLPGLTFCRGDFDCGTAILEGLGRYERNGLLPNFLSPDGEHRAYNSVDASLWYFWAVQQMLHYSGNREKIKSIMWPVMKKIVESFMTGAAPNVAMAENGLLYAGYPGTNLTWMDARVGDTPVTPRWGFAVEINALWYNALSFTKELAGAFGEELPFSEALLTRIPASFREVFWIEKEAYLGDVANDFLDRAIRPNQIFAVSLPFSPLDEREARGVVKKVEEHLLTPFGLRTLSPTDKAYRGRCEGDAAQRDHAYHQGTVWPWLLGPFGEACLKTKEDKEQARTFLLDHLRAFFRQHLRVAGVGCISEIFDGDPPHAPRGCISQAWSTGELIRLYTLLKE